MSAGVYGRFKPQPSPLVLRHPFAGHALRLGDLVGGQAPGQEVAVVHGIVTFLAGPVERGCEVEPFVRLHIVLRNALAFGVHETEVMHGFNVALVGGLEAKKRLGTKIFLR